MAAESDYGEHLSSSFAIKTGKISLENNTSSARALHSAKIKAIAHLSTFATALTGRHLMPCNAST